MLTSFQDLAVLSIFVVYRFSPGRAKNDTQGINNRRQAKLIYSFCVRFFRAPRGKTYTEESARTMLPQAKSAALRRQSRQLRNSYSNCSASVGQCSGIGWWC